MSDDTVPPIKVVTQNPEPVPLTPEQIALNQAQAILDADAARLVAIQESIPVLKEKAAVSQLTPEEVEIARRSGISAADYLKYRTPQS